MNFYSQNEKTLSLYGFLILAFEARLERFWLDAGNQRYLVTAEYAETPKVRCNLSVAAEEQDRWISLTLAKLWRTKTSTMARDAEDCRQKNS